MTARDRELWDAIVYGAYDYPIPNPMSENGMTSLPLQERRTLVVAENTVPTIQVCIQSSDESYAGERLAAYSDSSWWRRQIDRWTNFSWRGDIQIDACTDEPMTGWVHVREGDEGEVAEGALAHATSWRYSDPHGIGGRWARSEIVWHPEAVQDTSEEYFESTLAHELGHVLGLFHALPGSGFVMVSGETPPRPWTDKERWLSQWANRVGPNVQYPGLLRPTATAPGDLKGGVKDLVDEALADLQDDSDESNGRQAVESVPALPIAGVLLLAIVLGLLGGRRVRAG